MRRDQPLELVRRLLVAAIQRLIEQDEGFATGEVVEVAGDVLDVGSREPRIPEDGKQHLLQ